MYCISSAFMYSLWMLHFMMCDDIVLFLIESLKTVTLKQTI